MTTEERKQIADTILEQLGGRRFIAMTGAKNFVFDDNGSLSFQFDNKKKAFRVILDPSDTYTVEYFKINARSKTFEGYSVKQATSTGIYFDMLQFEFTRLTGFDTHL
jgi:hypothetical protein